MQRLQYTKKDFKSHTGATLSLGNGMICSMSTKQKLNTRSSTEAELVGVNDIISKVSVVDEIIYGSTRTQGDYECHLP